MAKAPKTTKVAQEEILGSLPDELIVDGQTTATETPTHSAVDAAGDGSTSNTDDVATVTEDGGDAGAGPDDDDIDSSNNEDPDNTQDDVDLGIRDVVVLKGNTIRHNGESYVEYSKITMDEADAERVVTLGKAEYLKVFREKAACRHAGVVISGD